MRFIPCDVCGNSVPETSDFIRLEYRNNNLGTQKKAKVCGSCMNKKLKQILYDIVGT